MDITPVAPVAAVSVGDAGHSGAHSQAAPASSFSKGVLNAGFVVGLVLATACLAIGAWYLIAYKDYASGVSSMFRFDQISGDPAAQQAQAQARSAQLGVYMYMGRMLLQSCGLAVGMAFGFLGFSLFLIGVQGSIDARAQAGGGVALDVARIAPGAFIMLCSTILVGICATQPIPAEILFQGQVEQRQVVDQQNSAGGGASPPEILNTLDRETANAARTSSP
jgi:hypothetical protein